VQGYSINNITVKEYFELKDSSEYDIFIDTINAKNEFSNKHCNVSKLTFDEVEVVKQIFQNPTIENIKELFIELFKLGSIEISAEKEFYNASIFDLFRAKRYLQDWIVDVIEKENIQLAGVPDEKLQMINAGERLKAVSHLLTKMRLGEQFGKSPNEIGQWKYNTVFTILVANKRSNDIQREYSEIK
jgi:hypothetical protein